MNYLQNQLLILIVFVNRKILSIIIDVFNAFMYI